MCGRTACSLDPDQLCAACAYSIGKGTKEPVWIDIPDEDLFEPSFNCCPKDFCPVLISSDHLVDEEDVELKDADDYVILPMKWGLVSSWLKDDDEERYGYRMINARAETLLQKPTFKRILNKGRRCVVVVDGFYEWKGRAGHRDPYFVYMPQKTQIDWNNVEAEDQDESIARFYKSGREFGEHNGRQLTFLAGMFDINRNLYDNPLFSYTIITVESAETIRFVHNRMPAVLLDENEVCDWLDFERVDIKQAIELLLPVEDLDYHRVAHTVNNVTFKGAKCVRPLLGRWSKPRFAADCKLLVNFFLRGKKH